MPKLDREGGEVEEVELHLAEVEKGRDARRRCEEREEHAEGLPPAAKDQEHGEQGQAEGEGERDGDVVDDGLEHVRKDHRGS